MKISPQLLDTVSSGRALLVHPKIHIRNRLGFFLAVSLASLIHLMSETTLLAAPLGGRSAPTVGGTLGMPAPTQGPSLFGREDLAIRRHKSAIGKECLTVSGVGRAKLANPHIFDHIILANNGCSLMIKVEVCYYQTDRCINVVVPGHTMKEAVLGIMPATRDFRFEFREQFP